jgi:hypothetical protein
VAASAAVASVEAVSEAGASNLFPQEIKGLYGWKAARCCLPSVFLCEDFLLPHLRK